MLLHHSGLPGVDLFATSRAEEVLQHSGTAAGCAQKRTRGLSSAGDYHFNTSMGGDTLGLNAGDYHFKMNMG